MQFLSMLGQRGQFYTQRGFPPGTTPGVLDQWNGQLQIDFGGVSFGMGRPSRLVHWFIGEKFKAVKDAQDNIEVNSLFEHVFCMIYDVFASGSYEQG